MKLVDLISRTREALNAKIGVYNECTTALNALRAVEGFDTAREDALMGQRAAVDAEIKTLRGKLELYEREQREDERVNKLQERTEPLRPWPPADGEERTVTAGTAGFGAQARDVVRTGGFVRAVDLRPAAVAPGQRVAQHPVAADMISRSHGRDQAIIGQHGDLGQLVRALTTTGGSAIVPSIWAADVIDLARNTSAVLQAGAQIVPMDAKTVQIGRLTGDPSAAFRTEGSAITASDPTFDNVTLTAASLNTLVIGSMEWFQDATNAEELVTRAIAEAIAAKIDLVALYGSITTGAGAVNLPTPPNPRGILGALNATAPTSVLGGATNGTAQTSGQWWNEILDLAYTPRDYNETPAAMIWNSTVARHYAKAVDTTGQPLQQPGDVAALRKFVSNQIPTYTQGTMPAATDVFTGDWSQLLIGQRLDLTIQVLPERYADTGQIGIVATWRGDVGLARPRAFSVFRALKAA